jgi:hypothetical protein
MTKISLKSIQNNNINHVKPKTTQKPVKNVAMKVPKQSDKVVTKQSLVFQDKNIENKPIFNDILTSLQKNIVENKENLVHEQPTNEFHKQVKKEQKAVNSKELSESERNKLIGLLHLYISEFPDKLKTYKGKNFLKMTNDELIDMKELFKKEVNTSNNLSMAVEFSVNCWRCMSMYVVILCK